MPDDMKSLRGIMENILAQILREVMGSAAERRMDLEVAPRPAPAMARQAPVEREASDDAERCGGIVRSAAYNF